MIQNASECLADRGWRRWADSEHQPVVRGVQFRTFASACARPHQMVLPDELVDR